MNVTTITAGAVATNSYVISNGLNECIVVDPGDGIFEIIRFLDKNALECKYVFLTHAHFDHCDGCRELRRRGAKVYMSADDLSLLSTVDNLAEAFGEKFEPFEPDVLVNDGDELLLLGEKFNVIATPGHTKGSVCYKVNGALFTGDTLFRLSIGRTDFPTGNYADMKNSLAKLFVLDGDYIVYPGHGDKSTLSYERKYNPYARI